MSWKYHSYSVTVTREFTLNVNVVEDAYSKHGDDKIAMIKYIRDYSMKVLGVSFGLKDTKEIVEDFLKTKEGK